MSTVVYWQVKMPTPQVARGCNMVVPKYIAAVALFQCAYGLIC